MQSYVSIGQREVLVEIEAQGQGVFEVTVDGVAYSVDAAGGDPPSAGSTLLIDGRQFEVFAQRQQSSGSGRRYLLSVDGAEQEATVTDPLAHFADEAGGAAGSARVEAYMPGRVVTLLVAEGDTVEAGQGVLVLEAMKMENEIAAEAAGVVSQILVEPGQAVEGGDPLFEVTPAD